MFAVMPITEAQIASVVAEASSRMHETEYITSQVNAFIAAQPMIARYVISHSDELTVEGVVTVLFHAALIHLSISRARGAASALVQISELDAAAQQSPTVEELSRVEPDLASYIASNIELGQHKAADQVARTVLAHVAQSLVST